MKRLHKLVPWLYIIAFALVLAVPVLKMNRLSDAVSEEEKRALASKPVLFDETGRVTADFTTQYDSWMGDNIGFRSLFMQLSSDIRFALFHQSLSDQVEIGAEGWYYYTGENNLDIATGTYPRLDEEALEMICRQQVAMAKKLSAQGIEYVLVLPPSKVSVYPEFIRGGEYELRQTPADIVADYLEEHSSLHVVRLKQALLDAKDEGLLYYKTDTHWNERGAYYAYRKIVEDLNRWGIIDSPPAEVTYGESTQSGDLVSMMGLRSLLGYETCPAVQISERTGTQVLEGERLETLRTLGAAAGVQFPQAPGFLALFENESVPENRMLSFGDSFFGTLATDEACVPHLLGENFSEVVWMRTFQIDRDVIDYVKPSVVTFNLTERYLNNFRSMQTDTLFYLTDALDRWPEDSLAPVGSATVLLEGRNGQTMTDSGQVVVSPERLEISVGGWAVDFNTGLPFSALYCKVGDTVFECDYFLPRPDVAEVFGSDALKDSGFKVDIPVSYLQDGQVTELSFYAVSADGQTLYEPIGVQLVYP